MEEKCRLYGVSVIACVWFWDHMEWVRFIPLLWVEFNLFGWEGLGLDERDGSVLVFFYIGGVEKVGMDVILALLATVGGPPIIH